MVMQAQDSELRPEQQAHLRSSCGRSIPLHVPRWFDEPGPEEQAVLDEAMAPMLDIGCGPGRHTLALAARGVDALGIDAASESVVTARARGASVLHRSIFEPLPGEGTWGGALLLDGNVGIGGDPATLFLRVHGLLRRRGRLLLELDPPGTPSSAMNVRPKIGDAGWLPWSEDAPFAWATVGADDLPALAAATGFAVRRVWSASGRWFARADSR